MDHTYSHTIDGLGYSYSDIYTKQRLRTLDKSILGLWFKGGKFDVSNWKR